MLLHLSKTYLEHCHWHFSFAGNEIPNVSNQICNTVPLLIQKNLFHSKIKVLSLCLPQNYNISYMVYHIYNILKFTAILYFSVASKSKAFKILFLWKFHLASVIFLQLHIWSYVDGFHWWIAGEFLSLLPSTMWQKQLSKPDEQNFDNAQFL